MKMLSLKRPLPSMLIFTFQDFSTEVNASLVNWPFLRPVKFRPGRLDKNRFQP